MGRRLIAAVAIAAQVAMFLLPAIPSAFAAPCPVHAGIAQADHNAGPDHGQTAPADSDQGPLHPMIFGFACCASHMVGIFSFPLLDVPSRIAALAVVEIAEAFASGELASIDPPPRSLL